MSNENFSNINYEQFEVEANDEMYKSKNARIKREMKNVLKNKFSKTRLYILCITFFFCFIIIMIIYIKKIIDYNKLERKVMDHIFFPYHSDLIPL